MARHPGDYSPFSVSRLRYFIKIDEEVLQSLAGYLESGWSAEAFVKIVDADWESLSEIAARGEEVDDLPDVCEPVYGCTEIDVGWMCIAPNLIHTEFYIALDGDEMAWEDQFYKRPPDIFRW